MKKTHLRGQAVTEFIIVMPLFLILLGGIFEFVYIYRAKVTLNTATFEAARAGSLNHARLSPMRKSLAKGMIPLFMNASNVDNAPAAIGNMTVAYGKARLAAEAMDKASDVLSPNIGVVDVISPTKAIFEYYKVKRRVRLQHESEFFERDIIPNDSLLFRSSESRDIGEDGAKVNINIQDANLLKIRTFWCYKLKVPLVKTLIRETVSGLFGILNTSPEQRVCNGAELFTGDEYIALVSQSTIRMQSHIVQEGGNLK
ncbi:TadE family protein [uncultured Gilvimarinus sp.]|uniref:TadE/TadG family type IV pilus assembly protein n=1 Tax=uncultured Gilvimarinus sp. TaxID=1689143 RepID=UPI0030EBCAB0|tara:strand:- start:1629 stop:2399 length:771 start_codon:yes stop_codon:yes gene_type:complete